MSFFEKNALYNRTMINFDKKTDQFWNKNDHFDTKMTNFDTKMTNFDKKITNCDVKIIFRSQPCLSESNPSLSRYESHIWVKKHVKCVILIDKLFFRGLSTVVSFYIIFMVLDLSSFTHCLTPALTWFRWVHRDLIWPLNFEMSWNSLWEWGYI